MKKLKKITHFALCFLLINLAFVACNDDDDPIDNSSTTDYSSALYNIGNNVIIKTYADLRDYAQTTVNKSQQLTIGNQEALDAVKQAWIDMRAYWEFSETTLYGPASDEGLGVDGHIDSWPIDLVFVQAILDGGTPITAESLVNQDTNAKGFHALEYLLWGIDGNKSANDLTLREIEYIQALSQYILSQTSDLYSAWTSGYINNLTNSTSGIFHSQIGALHQIVDGLIVIVDEVGNTKIESPMYDNGGNFELEAEESRFSNNSKQDFADNIRGVWNIYMGDYSSSQGAGLTDIVSAKNSTLDNEIKTAIQEAITGIESIPGTFTEAIQHNRPAVEAAQDKVNALQTILESKLKPFISSL